jgi:hypothetical protein
MSKLMSLIMLAGLTLMLVCPSTTSFAQEKWALCKPVETMSFSTRVHVKCEVPVDGVFLFFAVSTEDARFASRMLNLSMVGQVAEKTLSVLFDPNDQSGATFGCLAHDCRTARAIGLTEAVPPTPAPPPRPPSPPPPPPPSRAECLAKCDDNFSHCVDPLRGVSCDARRRICQGVCPR